MVILKILVQICHILLVRTFGSTFVKIVVFHVHYYHFLVFRFHSIDHSFMFCENRHDTNHFYYLCVISWNMWIYLFEIIWKVYFCKKKRKFLDFVLIITCDKCQSYVNHSCEVTLVCSLILTLFCVAILISILYCNMIFWIFSKKDILWSPFWFRKSLKQWMKLYKTSALFFL